MNRELKLVGNTVVGGKQFDMSYSDGAIQKAQYGITDDYYGGMLKEFRKVKGYDGIMLCLDKRDNVINVAYVESELCDNGRRLLGLAPVEDAVTPVEDAQVIQDADAEELPGEDENDGEFTDARKLLGLAPVDIALPEAKAKRKR